jgi:hypothetical protein
MICPMGLEHSQLLIVENAPGAIVAYLVGTVDEVVYKSNSNELKAEARRTISYGLPDT